jgi:DNA-binding transcriptional MerR regulator
MTDRIPIGEFARMCRLTVKALRHYDDLGLLKPDYVDRKTSYRYYRREQARTALHIAMLREIDVPIPAIRAALEARDAEGVAHALAEERVRIERSIRRSRAALASLELVIAQGKLSSYPVVIRDEPARSVARITSTTNGETHVADTTHLVTRLCDALASLAVTHGDPIFAILPNGLSDEPFPVHVCVSVTGKVPADPRFTHETLPPSRCAVVTHRGPYETLGLAHFALYGWLAEQGLAQTLPLRESYISDPKALAPEALVTEVLLPFDEDPRNGSAARALGES